MTPFSASGNSFSIHEWRGSGPALLHVHHSDDEAWHVLEGELTVWLAENEEPVTLGPNDAFQLPAHTRFRYANLSDQLTRVIWVFT